MWSWIAWVLLAVLLLFITLTAIDRRTRRQLSSTLRVDYYESSAKKLHCSTLLVYLPGMLTDGRTSSQQLLSVWRNEADVLLVSYEGDRFDAEAIAFELTHEIDYYVEEGHYSRVVFIGSSIGGLVSYDALRYIRSKDSRRYYPALRNVRFHVVLIDAPTGVCDLRFPFNVGGSLMAYLWRPGRLSNRLSRFVLSGIFREPKPDCFEDATAAAKFGVVADRARSYQLSYWLDQVRYVVDRGPLRPDILAGVGIVYVRSSLANDAIRESVIESWRSVLSVKRFSVYQVHSTSAGYSEWPTAWQVAFSDVIFPALNTVRR